VGFKGDAVHENMFYRGRDIFGHILTVDFVMEVLSLFRIYVGIICLSLENGRYSIIVMLSADYNTYFFNVVSSDRRGNVFLKKKQRVQVSNSTIQKFTGQA